MNSHRLYPRMQPPTFLGSCRASHHMRSAHGRSMCYIGLLVSVIVQSGLPCR